MLALDHPARRAPRWAASWPRIAAAAPASFRHCARHGDRRDAGDTGRTPGSDRRHGGEKRGGLDTQKRSSQLRHSGRDGRREFQARAIARSLAHFSDRLPECRGMCRRARPILTSVLQPTALDVLNPRGEAVRLDSIACMTLCWPLRRSERAVLAATGELRAPRRSKASRNSLLDNDSEFAGVWVNAFRCVR